MNEPLTMTVDEAAKLLGVSRGLAYEAIRRDELPAIRLGRRLVVPRAKLLELVGAQEMREPDDLGRAQDSRETNVHEKGT